MSEDRRDLQPSSAVLCQTVLTRARVIPIKDNKTGASSGRLWGGSEWMVTCAGGEEKVKETPAAANSFAGCLT